VPPHSELIATMCGRARPRTPQVLLVVVLGCLFCSYSLKKEGGDFPGAALSFEKLTDPFSNIDPWSAAWRHAARKRRQRSSHRRIHLFSHPRTRTKVGDITILLTSGARSCHAPVTTPAKRFQNPGRSHWSRSSDMNRIILCPTLLTSRPKARDWTSAWEISSAP